MNCPELIIEDWGRISYAEAYVRQRAHQAAVIDARERPGVSAMSIALLEHDPVITVSRRRGADDHVLGDAAQLAADGIEVVATDRGGDVTYHGPGQLVVYAFIDLNVLGLRLHGYMRFLEDIVMATLAHFGVMGHRDACATGVWVGGAGPGTHDRKICAMGVRVSRWATMHGLALNVHPNLAHFQHIVPCGLVGRSVTSLASELGREAPTMDAVKAALADEFTSAFTKQIAATSTAG